MKAANMSDEDKLLKLRNSIDALDNQLLNLINKRASYAQKVAIVKEELGDEIYFKPEREANVLRSVMERNNGALINE